MAGKKFYFGSEQLETLTAEAERLKIGVEDLIRIKLESPTSDMESNHPRGNFTLLPCINA